MLPTVGTVCSGPAIHTRALSRQCVTVLKSILRAFTIPRAVLSVFTTVTACENMKC